MNSPFFTIVTACYHSEETIRDTIESVQRQSFQDYEHLFIDGASNDKTVEIIKSYNDPKIRVISEPDKGIYDAMNKGIIKAQGLFIATLNSDDYYKNKEVLQVVHDQSLQFPEAEIIHGNTYKIKDGEFIKRGKPDYNKEGKVPKWKMPIIHPSSFVKKSVYEKIGLYDLKYKLASDYLFMCKCLDEGIMDHYIDEDLTVMRHGGSTSEDWKLHHKEGYQALLEVNGTIIDRIALRKHHFWARIRYLLKIIFQFLKIYKHD